MNDPQNYTFDDSTQDELPQDRTPSQIPRKTQAPPPTITIEPDAVKAMKYSRSYETQKPGGYQNFLISMGKLSGSFGIIPCCICCPNPWEEVKQGYVGLVTQFGELAKVVDPGPVYINKVTQKMRVVSIMTQVQEIPEQSCLTRDNVIVHLKSVIYYNIVDPQKAVFGITDIQMALSERTQTTLRDVIGARMLQNVIEHREEIADAIHDIIRQVAADWGVLVESILIKDLRLSEDITQSLSQAAQAKRIGESKIITAKAEVESAKLMRQAADILASKPAMQIRYLEAMQAMARSSGAKVIFMPTSASEGGAAAAVDDEEIFNRDDVVRQMALKESLDR